VLTVMTVYRALYTEGEFIWGRSSEENLWTCFGQLTGAKQA